jgi:predicted transcriptional regulator
MAIAKSKVKKKAAKPSQMVSLRLEMHVVDALDVLAEKQGRTRTNLITQILREYKP